MKLHRLITGPIFLLLFLIVTPLRWLLMHAFGYECKLSNWVTAGFMESLGIGMNRKKIIVGYEVRNKKDNGIRLCRLYLQEAKDHCPFGCAVWSTYRKVYGVRLRFFWMRPFRKVQYDKYSNVFNFFNLHIGWDLMKRTVPIEIVYKPQDEPASGE